MSPEDIGLVYNVQDILVTFLACEINLVVTVVTGVSAITDLYDLEACGLPKQVWVIFSGAEVPESLPFVRAEKYALR